MISNTMILNFQNDRCNQLLSIKEIMRLFLSSAKRHGKYYFKIFQKNLWNSSMGTALSPDRPSISNNLNRYGTTDSEVNQLGKKAISASNEIGSEFYYEFEFRNIKFPNEHTKLSSCNYYFTDSDELCLMTIRDITQIIKNQQRISDRMYQDAIEANYSHEQMTPLNCILGTSALLVNRMSQLHLMLKDNFTKLGMDDQIQTLTKKNDETLNMINSVNQSAQVMWFYNRNQIQRMKIKKKEFD